ncbi:MAG: helix-hairpin-helix domain-containing protein [Bacteroidota bacterium]
MSRPSTSYREALRADVARLLEDVATTRKAQAEALRAERTAFTEALRTSVSSDLSSERSRVKDEVQSLLEDIRAEHATRRDTLRTALRTFRTALRNERGSASASALEVASEIGQAAPAPAPPSPPVEENLLRIKGIGPNTLERLRQAGIHSFADLAASTPADLHQALGGYAKLINVEEWLSEARRYAQS